MGRHALFAGVELGKLTMFVHSAAPLLHPLEYILAPHVTPFNVTNLTSQDFCNFDARRILIGVTQNGILFVVDVLLHELVDLPLERVLDVVAEATMPGVLSQNDCTACDIYWT